MRWRRIKKGERRRFLGTREKGSSQHTHRRLWKKGFWAPIAGFCHVMPNHKMLLLIWSQRAITYFERTLFISKATLWPVLLICKFCKDAFATRGVHIGSSTSAQSMNISHRTKDESSSSSSPPPSSEKLVFACGVGDRPRRYKKMGKDNY